MDEKSKGLTPSFEVERLSPLSWGEETMGPDDGW
jgi:hypothetical protein